MKIAFNPSTVKALTTPPNNKDITFDLRGQNIFARGVKFCGTDTNTWRDIKINNISIGSNILDLRNGSNTTLTNTNGVVTINSTWRPVVDNLTSDSTTSSLSAKQGKVLKSLIDGKSNSGHNHDDRYYTKAESNAKYITDITTSINKLTFTKNGSNINKDITVNVVYSLGNLTNISDKNSTTKASSGLVIYNSYSLTIGTNSYSSVLSINTGGTIQIAGNWGDDLARNLYWRSLSDRPVADYPWKSWRTILDSENYSSTLDSRYYTKSEVNTKLGTYLPLSGGTVTGNIILKGATSADMTYADNIHPYIRFDNLDSDQNVSLIFTDYDTYRRPAGIKLVGNQGNEWFEVLGYNYSSGYVKNGSNDNYVLLGGGGHSKITDLSVSNADTVDGYHANGLLTALSNSNNGISITVGGTTKSISNISVDYASNAGNADTVDGKHASSFVRAGHYESADLNNLDTYSFIKSVNSNNKDTSPKGNTGWYNVILAVHRNGNDDGPGYIGQIALGMTTNTNDMFFRGRRTDPWKTVIHSGNYTEFIDNYYWANVKISTSSSTTTSPTVSNLTATSSIKMGNILLQNTNEINNSANGNLNLNLRSSGNVTLCYGGGNVGIGTSPLYKLDVAGEMRSRGFHYAGCDSNDYILLAGGGYMIHKTGTTEYSTAILFGKYVWLTILMYNTRSGAQVVPDNISKPTKDIYVYGAASDRGISIWSISTGGIIYLEEGTTSVTHLYTTICYVAS